jgi:hypothetical protein
LNPAVTSTEEQRRSRPPRAGGLQLVSRAKGNTPRAHAWRAMTSPLDLRYS